MQAVTPTVIPNRPVFRAQEVCELADLQPYVLRTWEAEFPDLGVAKTAGGPRIYRRSDVERVLHIKHLLFVDGLTLAGVRRRIGEAAPSDAQAVSDADVAALIDEETRRELRDVRRGLQWILDVLSGGGLTPEDFVLKAERPAASAAAASGRAPARKASSSRTSRPAARTSSASGAKKTRRGKKR
jgi:DNA-binding transcriptional MerR regulator